MERTLDYKGRWRNHTVAFRVSDEEAKLLNDLVALSGLTKQDYITRRLLCRDVVVQGNPRVYKALKNQMAAIYEKLKRLEALSPDNDELLYTLQVIAITLDGAFIMHKKKRTDNEAVMDIVGRDQPDQELTIEFDRERCVWKFKKAETELWKQPPNPLLEAINNFLTEDKPEWEGTATELVSQLPDMQIQANVLSRKLNVVNSQLLNNYGIFYDNKRGHERKIVLKRLEPRE